MDHEESGWPIDPQSVPRADIEVAKRLIRKSGKPIEDRTLIFCPHCKELLWWEEEESSGLRPASGIQHIDPPRFDGKSFRYICSGCGTRLTMAVALKVSGD